MEAFAYTQAYTSYEEAMGIEYEFPEMALNWKRLPSSAWMGAVAIAVMAAAVSSTAPAHALEVRTPSGRCLNARYGPGVNYGVHTCVRNGATLLPMVENQGSWMKLSSGRWVYGPYTSNGGGSRPGTGGVLLLRPGARGSAVSSFQRRLDTLGYNVGSAGTDGVFGPSTASAVRSFQRRNGLLVDGIVGPRTLRAMGLS
ncbi:MAG: peptidoglycan-binding domain-containing protein [Cyanobacteriota bacterium]|nr:peptidoglycan-binding domain-containing protein [Cyanobacteriota bacterium]